MRFYDVLMAFVDKFKVFVKSMTSTLTFSSVRHQACVPGSSFQLGIAGLEAGKRTVPTRCGKKNVVVSDYDCPYVSNSFAISNCMAVHKQILLIANTSV